MKWQNTWSYTQQDYRSWPSLVKPESQSIELICNYQSQKMKLTFSNLYGIERLNLSKIEVSVKHLDGTYGSAILSVLGKSEVSLGAGEECVSDPVDIEVRVGSRIKLTTTLAQSLYLTSGTVTYSRQELDVVNRNQKGQLIKQSTQFKMVKENPRMTMVYGISAVHLLVDQKVSLVAFGDSLTQQGYWLDALNRRLRQEGYHKISLLNRGIGGNRILAETDHSEDGYYRHGRAGLARFEREVFGESVPDVVLVLHGINDFIHQQLYIDTDQVTAQEVIEGLKKYAEICHQYGSKAVIATLTPMSESVFYSPRLAASRKAVNQWIRHQEAYDLVVDFDSFVREESNPEKLSSAYDSGDGLHLSLAGGQKIASSFDLHALFKQEAQK